MRVHCGMAEPVSLPLVTCLALAACATKPLVPYSTDTPPLALVPASQAGVQDKRARFREIYCAVLEAHGAALADYRALRRRADTRRCRARRHRRACRSGPIQAAPHRGSGARHRVRLLQAVAECARHRHETPAANSDTTRSCSMSTGCRVRRTMHARFAMP